MRSPPSMKVSAMATRGITKAATGMENWFKRGQSPLSSSVQENKLLYFSASNMMAAKHNTKCVSAKNAVKVAAVALLAVKAMSIKLLKHAWRLAHGGLAQVDGYIHQEEAPDEDH